MEPRGAITAPFFQDGVLVVRADVWTSKGYSSRTFAATDKISAREWIDEKKDDEPTQ